MFEKFRTGSKDLDAATKRGEDLGLTDDEIAFYDALAVNESAVTAMGDAKLKVIAAELIVQVRKSVTIDWTLRESARAKIKVKNFFLQTPVIKGIYAIIFCGYKFHFTLFTRQKVRAVYAPFDASINFP